LADLVERYGPAAPTGGTAADHGLVVADPHEAFVLETAGGHWVYQEVRQVRAVGGVRVIRQDWDRISPGLAQEAIAQGRWPEDGSKLDFAAAMDVDAHGQADDLRRWGRATLLLEQQNEHIDAAFLRRVLADHDEDADRPAPDGARASLCRHG